VPPERELISAQAGLAAAVAVESGPDLGEGTEPVRARSYWEQVWIRFRRDKVAMASGFFVIFLVLVAIFGGPLAAALLGHGPNDLFFSGVNNDLLPVGPWTHVQKPGGGTTLFILGADGTLGRDEFLRLLYGARVSLEVAVLSTIGDRLNNITLGIFGKGVVTLVLVFTVFGWYYPARIVRSSVLSLREKEFVEAARMVGASDMRIMRSHVLPHLVAPIVVVSTLIVAQYIILEAGLSFLGLGIKLPTASWGVLLAAAPEFYTTVPWLMLWPGLAVLFTTLAFNLLGDGMRDAFDPRAAQH